MTRDELQRLIDVVVQELLAADRRATARCSCHSVLADCCPERLRGVIDAGATRVIIRPATSKSEPDMVRELTRIAEAVMR